MRVRPVHTAGESQRPPYMGVVLLLCRAAGDGCIVLHVVVAHAGGELVQPVYPVRPFEVCDEAAALTVALHRYAFSDTDELTLVAAADEARRARIARAAVGSRNGTAAGAGL